MKMIIGILLLAATAAQGAEVCRILTMAGPISAKSYSECTLSSENIRIEVKNVDYANSTAVAKLLMIKALAEKGYSMMADGESFIKK